MKREADSGREAVPCRRRTVVLGRSRRDRLGRIHPRRCSQAPEGTCEIRERGTGQKRTERDEESRRTFRTYPSTSLHHFLRPSSVFASE